MLGTAVLLQHVRRLAGNASSDEQLLADFLARRSDEAFPALLCRHGPMVLNVCRRILHDAHAAEDVFQATFLVLANRAGAIHRRASLAGFLHGVAYRLAVRARRRNSPKQGDRLYLTCASGLCAGVCDKAAGPPEELAWKEMLGILDHELGQLSDRYRAPLVLCYLEERTQDEAARQLGWSINTLRRRLVRGRRLLEVRLRGRGVTLPTALSGLLAASAVAVPGNLRAATLAAAGARAAGGMTAGVCVHFLARKGTTLILSTAGKKVGSLIMAAALASAVCFAYCRDPHADQAPAAEEMRDEGSGTREENVSSSLILHPSSLIPSSDPLPVHGAVRLGTARYRHGGRIKSLAVAADGTRAATTSGWAAPESARVFDLVDGRCLYTLPRNPGTETEAVALSPDGKILATKQDNTVRLRDAATGKERCKIELPSRPGGRTITEWLAFTPDGRYLAVTPSGNVVYLIHVETQDVAGKFPHDKPVFACAFSPDGKLMATGGDDNEKGMHFIRLWDVTARKEVRRFSAGDGRIWSLAFSPDGATLAGGGGDARLRLWDVATGKEQRTFPRRGRPIRSVAFAPDGKAVAAAGDRVHVYDTSTGKERLRIDRRTHGLQFSRDGKVLTGAVSGAIYRWDTATGRLLTPSAAQDSAVEQILVTPDGRRVFTRDQEGDLHVWESVTGKYIRRIPAAADRGVLLTQDGRFLAWSITDDTVRTPDPSHSGWVHSGSRLHLYDIVTEQFLNRFSAVKDEACVQAILPDRKTILTLDRRTATVRLWDIDSGKERRSFPVAEGTNDFPCVASRASLSPDGKTLAIGYNRADNISTKYRAVPIRLWDVVSGKAGPRLMGHVNSVDGLAFSPDGRLLVTWAENPWGNSMMDHVLVWDTATGRAVPTLHSGLSIGAGSAAFAPDERTLATASAGGTVRLWEVATWEVRAEFRGHRDRVTALAFGPGGTLFSGGLDTTVIRWDVRPPLGVGAGTLADAWQTLAYGDAKSAFRAQGRFLAEPARAVEWFKSRLTPAVRLDPSRVKTLIAELDNDDFATRERATVELKDHWPAAAVALREVVKKSPSAEVRRRAERILRTMEKVVTPPSELRALRATEILEWIGTKEAHLVLHKLTKGAPDAHVTREATAACKRLEGRK
jgi:RNA polymerase sigma factor (sigma-70 family)